MTKRLTKTHPKCLSLTTLLFLYQFRTILSGDAFTFQGASPWVPPGPGFLCRMQKRLNSARMHENHKQKHENTKQKPARKPAHRRPSVYPPTALPVSL